MYRPDLAEADGIVSLRAWIMKVTQLSMIQSIIVPSSVRCMIRKITDYIDGIWQY